MLAKFNFPLSSMHQWAHFPHIHFGLMPDQGMKKTSIQSQVRSYEDQTLIMYYCVVETSSMLLISCCGL
jgi:hypothetical protein